MVVQPCQTPLCGLPGLHAWKELGMPGLLRRLGFSSTHASVAEALVIGRMAEPMSEHAFHKHIPLTALPDILGDRLLKISLDTFYQTSHPHAQKHVIGNAIENPLNDALKGLHNPAHGNALTRHHKS